MTIIVCSVSMFTTNVDLNAGVSISLFALEECVLLNSCTDMDHLNNQHVNRSTILYF